MSRARVVGLVRCGLVWLCPVCAVRIGEVRREELEAATASVRRLGGESYMVSITMAHTRFDSLSDALGSLSAAWYKLHSGKLGVRFRALEDSYGFFGSIRSTETTWGSSNGWHPHYHLLSFAGAPLSPDQLLEFESEFFSLWSVALARVGRECSREHGVVVQRTYGAVADYVEKFGKLPEKRRWSSSDELVGWYRKQGREGRFTPFQLLRAWDETGEKRFLSLWLEFADAFKGQPQLYWAQGLKSFLGVDGVSDQAALDRVLSADESEFMSWSPWQFAGIRHYGRLPHLHAVADRGDVLLADLIVRAASEQYRAEVGDPAGVDVSEPDRRP